MPNLDGSLTFEEFVKLYAGGGSAIGGGVMQGIEPAAQQAVPQGVMDLNHHKGAGVTYNRASGTDPMMMAGAGAVGAGLNAMAQPVVNSLGFPDSRGFDTPAEANAYTMDATEELVNSMTDAEHNVYMQLDDLQRPAFLEALRQNKIPSYEAENFDRLMRPY